MRPALCQRSSASIVSYKKPGFETPLKRARGNNFEATQKWKEMIKRFINEVPLDKNRRLMRHYIDTFTGMTAADTLELVLARVFPERSCTRANAILVLQKFIEEFIIEDAHNPECRRFKDDTTLYRIREAGLSRYDLRLPARVRRSASLDTSLRRDKFLNVSASTSASHYKENRRDPPVRLLKHRNLSCSMNVSSHSVSPNTNDGEPTPPKVLRVRYASGDSNEIDGTNKTLFYTSQLTKLLDGIISDPHLGDRERHEKIMRFKTCYPDIFDQRFPSNSYVVPQFSLLDRLKNMIGV